MDLLMELFKNVTEKGSVRGGVLWKLLTKAVF